MKEEVKIGGVVYVPKSEVKAGAKKKKNMKYVIVRTYSAGVFAGYLEERTGKEVIMRDARKLWYWDGASTLSQLAMEGVSKPDTCKFPCEVDKIELLEAVEILDCTEAARESIAKVPVWSS